MRKPFRTQNAAVTAAFFIAPVGAEALYAGSWSVEVPAGCVQRHCWFTLSLSPSSSLSDYLCSCYSADWGYSGGGLPFPVGTISGVALLALLGRFQMPNGHWLLMYSVVGAATGFLFWAIVTLGPEPSQSRRRRWSGDASRRRLGSKR